MNTGVNTVLPYTEYMTATSLAGAGAVFGDPELLQARAEAYNSVEDQLSVKPKEVTSFLGGLAVLTETLQHIGVSNAQRQKNDADLKNQILNLIKSGELLAYGFKIPRELNDQPILIPQDLFSGGNINWENSELENQNIQFSGIRVIQKLEIQNSNNSEKLENTKSENNKSEKPNFADLDPDLFIGEKEAGEYLGLSHRTLQGMRVKGGGPEFSKFGKSVRYRVSDLKNWANKNRKENTV